MSNYYTMQDSKVELMKGLIENGWKVYGYKADKSDSMTDYWSPARWEGIATKNGFVLVVDQFNNHYSGYEIKEYDYSKKVNYNPKIEKLYATMNDNASTENEKDVCQRKIEQLKEEQHNINNNLNSKLIEKYPTFSFGNPKNSNWHIEKDGVIIAKGTGIGSIYAGYNDVDETSKNVQKFISKFEKAISSNTEMVAVEKEVIKKVLKFVESDNKNLIEDETVVLINGSFTGSFHKGAKVIFKKSYTTKNGAVSYEFRRIGKRNQELKLKSENMFIVGEESFNKWVSDGLLTIGSIQEVEEVATKTVYVKKERKATTKTENKINNEVSTIDTVKVAPVENVTMELNEEKNGVELYFYSIPSTETRSQLKENGFRWSKFKKCWYAKQTNQTVQFAKMLTNTVDTVEVEEEVVPETTVQEETTINNINDEIETLKAENDVIKSAIEEVEEQIEMTALYDNNGKIEVNHIVINWSESAYLEDNSKYFTWAELDKAIYNASCHAPNNEAYDKTSYTVTWSDGTIYTGRIDLQYKDSYKNNIIQSSIHDYLTFRNGTNKPDHMTNDEYSLHMEHDKEKLEQIERYLNELSFTDDEPITPPEKPTKEANSNVVNLFDYNRNNEQSNTKQPVKRVVNASDSIIDFVSVHDKKEEEKATQEQLDKFINNIYPYMTRNDIETIISLRNDPDDEIPHELAKITTRIELEQKFKKQ